MKKSNDDDAKSIGSSDDSQSQLSQPWENGSETTSKSYVSEIAIHSLLVEWKQRGLDRECIKIQTETDIPPTRRAQ